MPVTKVFPKESTFGNLMFLKEIREVMATGSDGRRVLSERIYSIVSDRQAQALDVRVPVSAGKKLFRYNEPVRLVNPVLEATGVVGNDSGIANLKVTAADIVALDSK